MANPSIVEKYVCLIKGLFPTGEAWQFSEDADGNKNFLAKLADALAVEPCRVEERAFKLLEELDPNTTFELIEEWEAFLRIPDECTNLSLTPTTQERRLRILQKLTTGGGQTKAFYVLIASQLGYDITINDVVEFQDFRAGRARAGDRLSNSTLPNGDVDPATCWVYAFEVQAPAESATSFRAGQGAAGDRLRVVENLTLECILEKFKPAHTKLIFSLVE